jgi:hypothetical protein
VDPNPIIVATSNCQTRSRLPLNAPNEHALLQLYAGRKTKESKATLELRSDILRETICLAAIQHNLPLNPLRFTMKCDLNTAESDYLTV